jgi:histidinol-phosphate phosphatase family protein
VRLLPDAAETLAALQSEGWKLFVVSNQSGVRRGFITPERMDAVQERFISLMRARGVKFSASYLCVHSPDEQCACRKPSDYFLRLAAEEHEIDLGASWMIGDREGDILCGKNAGCSTIWLRNRMFTVPEHLPTLAVDSWLQIRDRLRA